MSDVRPAATSNHQLQWTVEDSGGIAEGEKFTITFPTTFNATNITAAEIGLKVNGSARVIGSSCGSVQARAVNNGNGDIVITICSGGGGAIASGSVVVVNIGTDVVGGNQQITNPTTAGGYTIILNGGNGYSDSSKTQVAILSGVATSASVPSQTGDLRIIGVASPYALITFTENASVIGTALSNGASGFDKTLSGLTVGLHFISLFATDTVARTTLTITFNINILPATTLTVSGLLLPPTISLINDLTSVKRPASLVIGGKAASNSTVRLFITGSGDSRSESRPVDNSGNWDANANPTLHLGSKNAYSIAIDNLGGQSVTSKTKSYEVLMSADLNVDNLVNLTDFSILMFNYGTNNPPNVLADINDNSEVNLTDFSIMMFYWTGG